MPSKKWHNARSLTGSKHKPKGKGKGSGLEKGKGQTHHGDAPASLSLPPIQRPITRASTLYASASRASILHSRALRPTSPLVRATSPRNRIYGVRPRSQSLPVQKKCPDRKRLRRPTLTSSDVSRVLFEEKQGSEQLESKTKLLETAEIESDKKVESTKPQAIPNDLEKELKTPDFHSLPAPPSTVEDLSLTKGIDQITPISRFEDLLMYAGPPRRFIAVDIDETLLMTNQAPAIILTSVGVTAFQQYVHKQFADFKTKNQLCRDLEKRIKDKVLVESSIASTIRDLQDSGCWVFGLTARYHEMAGCTERALSGVGLNLALTAPFPPKTLRDPRTGAVCVNGVIYCNGLNKGLIANRFFENVVMRGVLAATAQGKVPPAQGLPERFVFIDDQRSQLDCIQKDFHVAKSLGIPITLLHYTPESLVDICAGLDEDVRNQVLLKQMQTFIEKKIILSNREALTLLSSTKSPLVSSSLPLPPLGDHTVKTDSCVEGKSREVSKSILTSTTKFSSVMSKPKR
jgi:hypothetical protein